MDNQPLSPGEPESFHEYVSDGSLRSNWVSSAVQWQLATQPNDGLRAAGERLKTLIMESAKRF